MLKSRVAKKLVIFVGSAERYGNDLVYKAVVKFLHKNGCSGATVTRAISGYGTSGKLRRSKLFRLIEDVPMRIEAVESEEKIMPLLPSIHKMVKGGLIEIQDTELIQDVSPEGDGEYRLLNEDEPPLRGTIRILVREDDLIGSRQLHRTLAKKLKAMGITEVSVYRKVDDSVNDGAFELPEQLEGSQDGQILIIATDMEHKILDVIPYLNEIAEYGSIALSGPETSIYRTSVVNTGWNAI